VALGVALGTLAWVDRGWCVEIGVGVLCWGLCIVLWLVDRGDIVMGLWLVFVLCLNIRFQRTVSLG